MTRHTEDNQQIQVITWFRTLQGYCTIPKHYILTHNNNTTQGLDTFAKRSFWKKRGGIAGIPDLVLYASKSGRNGLFIELKSESHRPKKPVNDLWWLKIRPDANGKETTKYGVTSTQSQIMLRLDESGYKCIVCFSAQDAIKIIERYLEEKVI